MANSARGLARDIDLYLVFSSFVQPDEASTTLTGMGKGAYTLEFPVQIETPSSEIQYQAVLSWSNTDRSRGTREIWGTLHAQRDDIDWGKLAKTDPYSLLPVEGMRLFAGRQSDLQQLCRTVLNTPMGSVIVFGQKRVGKTSLAKELIKQACEGDREVSPVYVESGEYVSPDPAATLSALGRLLCRRIRKISPAFNQIPIPEFKDSLTPLTEFLDEVFEADPRKRLLLVLDEFDELPMDLYKRGAMANGFFLTSRSLSGRPRLGIAVVGGEKSARSSTPRGTSSTSGSSSISITSTASTTGTTFETWCAGP